MINQIIILLKRKLEDLSRYGEVDIEVQRNALKEELQYYLLNFIYHHPVYSNWTMYGGSALRICHELNRMSVDLDFEIAEAPTDSLLNNFKKALLEHLLETYSTGPDLLNIKITNGRGLLLKFIIGDELGMSHPSKQVHVKIDLNNFTVPKAVTERIPVNHGQLSFVIKTYNMSALMASKIAAIFLRGQRGVGKEIYEEKGRDIYDLLWYMEKKTVPDLDYLKAKGVDVAHLQGLFDRLTVQMSKVNKTNLRNDLTPLFVDQTFISHWIETWLENYLRLVNSYNINTVGELREIAVGQDFSSQNFRFVYFYETKDKMPVRIAYAISDYWVVFAEGNISTEINEKVVELVTGPMKDKLSDKLKRFITLFYEKTENYLKKTNHVVIGNAIITKVIRLTADNLNQKEQMVLNKSALLSCELEDLLK